MVTTVWNASSASKSSESSSRSSSSRSTSSSAAIAADGSSGNAEGIAHPQDPCAVDEREHVGGDRAGQPVADVPAGELAQEPLARGADHHRAPERDDLVQAA